MGREGVSRVIIIIGGKGRGGLLEKGEEGLKGRGTIEGWPILLSSYYGAE